MIEELEVYRLAMEMGERVWRIVERWDFFAKDTVGKQWVRTADSVAANLSEGFGRFSFKENRQFGYYSRGSLFETRTWLTKARNRQLVATVDYDKLINDLNFIGRKLNAYIKSIGPTPGQVKEDTPDWPMPNDH